MSAWALSDLRYLRFAARMWGSLLCLFVLLQTYSAVAAPRKTLVWITIYDHTSHEQKDAGSGVVLNKDGFILTAHHLAPGNVSANEEIKVAIGSKNSTPLPATRFECANENIDICLLKINANDVPEDLDFFQFTCLNPHMDDAIQAWGFPGGAMNPSIHLDGKISGELGESFMFPAQIGFVHGMSGGPVLNKGGVVIGVTFGVAQQDGQDVNGFGFFTPIRFARTLLSDAGVECPSGDKLQSPNTAKLSSATLTLTTWPNGGWNAILTNPTKSAAVVSYASLEAKNPSPGQFDMGFPLTIRYGMKMIYKVGESPFQTDLPSEHASNVYLEVFGPFGQSCTNWRALRTAMFSPSSTFDKWQCSIRTDLVAVSGERATIRSEPFACSRIPIPMPAC